MREMRGPDCTRFPCMLLKNVWPAGSEIFESEI
jgi:hypothetical protein